MTVANPLSPRLIKGGIVTMDPDTSLVVTVISLQYNPDSLSRSLQIQAMSGGTDGVRVDALRLRGPAVETIKAEAMASAGALEIIPLEQALTLFVWSASRVIPVRLTEFSIAEEAFDPNLN